MLNQISKIGIVPVIKINDAEKAVPLAEALIRGGLSIAEITFRTDAAEEAIKKVSTAFPDMLTGAGTVLTVDQAARAKAAGAKFIVSPGFNPKVVTWCLENGITPVPGCTSPSEIEAALELGLKAVKFFPAEQSGGLPKIKALSAPYSGLKFIPTGGISLDNIGAYTRNKSILACGGSFMVTEELIENSDWDKITLLCRQAVNTMLGLEFEHLGINEADKSSAENTAQALSSLMGDAPVADCGQGIFVGSEFEVMKAGTLGANGHIGFTANSLEKAVYHLERQGVSFNYDSARYDASGRLSFIYLKDEIGGFAVHMKIKK